MAAEIEIPVGNAVAFGQYTGIAVLVRRTRRLLNGGKFAVVAKHINARQRERTVRTHSVAYRRGLT